MVTAMAMAKVMTWAMVMVTRLAGNEVGKGKGGKGNGDDNEGGRKRRGRGRQGNGNGSKGGGRADGDGEKRAIAAMTRLRGAGGGNDQPLDTTQQWPTTMATMATMTTPDVVGHNNQQPACCEGRRLESNWQQ
jgi:hypothetical protein